MLLSNWSSTNAITFFLKSLPYHRKLKNLTIWSCVSKLWWTFIAACTTMAHFTFIARMPSGRLFLLQQRFKLRDKKSQERSDNIAKDLWGKCFRHTSGAIFRWPTNSDIQFKSFENLPTVGAVQFFNWNHIVTQVLEKYKIWPEGQCQQRIVYPPEAQQLLFHNSCTSCSFSDCLP